MGGLKIGGGCGRAGAGARARGPSFRFSQLFPWPAAGREREGGEVAGEDSAETSGENFSGETESERRWRGVRREKSSTAMERERKKRAGRGGWCWRFGKRTVEKPLDSYERENSAESRQTDRRWLRLTGFATTLPFLPRWSSCSLIPLFPPSILLSFHHWCAILWLPPSQPVVLQQQPCYSLHMTCRHDPKHTHQDPKQVPHHTHTHTAATDHT